MDDNNWTFSKGFTSGFQEKHSELEERIATAKNSGTVSDELIQQISLEISKLSKSLTDATGSLPTYDQKTYENQLKALEGSVELLRTLKSTKPKFSFKRKAQSSAPQAAPIQVKTPDPISEKIGDASPSATFTLSSQSNKRLARSSLPNHTNQSDLTISDLNSCIVDLLPPVISSDSGALDSYPLRISALHASNLTKCIVLLPDIDGSAILHNLDRCILLFGCHQFRMHTSNKVDVLLSITSNPVIEDCHSIRFFERPDSLSRPNASTSLPFTVQDFSHIRATPSPNFTMASDAELRDLLNRLSAIRLPSESDNVEIDERWFS